MLDRYGMLIYINEVFDRPVWNVDIYIKQVFDRYGMLIYINEVFDRPVWNVDIYKAGV